MDMDLDLDLTATVRKAFRNQNEGVRAVLLKLPYIAAESKLLLVLRQSSLLGCFLIFADSRIAVAAGNLRPS
jgi:hypothetical protein